MSAPNEEGLKAAMRAFDEFTKRIYDEFHLTKRVREETAHIVSAYLAASSPPAIAPAGWRLVPVEPTPEMMEVYARHQCKELGLDPDEQVSAEWPRWYPMCQGWDALYKQMLSAAPEAIASPNEWVEKVRALPRYDGNGGARLGESVIVQCDNGRYVELEVVLALLPPATTTETGDA